MSAQSNWAVITGASSGIGAAIVRRLAKHEPDLYCLAVGRRSATLEEARQLAVSAASNGKSDRVHVVAADVSTPDGISKIVSALPHNASVKYLIHNAGMLGPIAPLAEIERSTWHQVVATNLEAPLFLTQALIPHLRRYINETGAKPRILNVSSGAALNAYEGWGPYCVTKAGLNMMYRCFSVELLHHDILVGSVRPGVVDTDMQVQIREYEGDQFPAQQKFVDLHKGGQLESPDKVATYFHWLLSKIGDDEFGNEEWDIRVSSKNDSRWNEFLSESGY
ncbi:hypothetical protein ACHAXS_008131 [Conticribra weissflogii]